MGILRILAKRGEREWIIMVKARGDEGRPKLRAGYFLGNSIIIFLFLS